MHRRSFSALVVSALLVMLLAAPAADAAQLARQPYLNSVTGTSAIVAFRLDSSCDAAVKLRTAGQAERRIASPSSGSNHVVTIDGLRPGTAYSYVVEACGANVGAENTFRSAAPATDQTIHFATMGDIGDGGSDVEVVANAVHANQPEFLVTLGDNAYSSGTESEFQNNFFEPLGPMLADTPIFPSPGNHEYETSNAGPYFNNFYLPTNNPQGSEAFYSFDWGHIHFVSFDSSCAVGLASNDACSLDNQMAFLEQDLAASSAPWKVVYMHHPPYSSGDHLSQPTLQRELGPIFERYGVDLVLTGHDHNYERSHPMKGGEIVGPGEGGVVYLVVGSGGAGLRSFPISQPDWSAFRDNRNQGFLEVKVNGGNLVGRFLNPNGQVVDSFELNKTVAPPPAQEYSLEVTVENVKGRVPLTPTFVAETTLENAEITWDFGDGETATGAQVNHTYTKSGYYEVTATASNGTQSLEKKVVVTADPATGPELPPAPPPSEDPGATPSPIGDGDRSGCGSQNAAMLLPVGLLGSLEGLRRMRRRKVKN